MEHNVALSDLCLGRYSQSSGNCKSLRECLVDMHLEDLRAFSVESLMQLVRQAGGQPGLVALWLKNTVVANRSLMEFVGDDDSPNGHGGNVSLKLRGNDEFERSPRPHKRRNSDTAAKTFTESELQSNNNNNAQQAFTTDKPMTLSGNVGVNDDIVALSETFEEGFQKVEDLVTLFVFFDENCAMQPEKLSVHRTDFVQKVIDAVRPDNNAEYELLFPGTSICLNTSSRLEAFLDERDGEVLNEFGNSLVLRPKDSEFPRSVFPSRDVKLHWMLRDGQTVPVFMVTASIGRGAQGRVFRAFCKDGPKALKEFDLEKSKRQVFEKTMDRLIQLTHDPQCLGLCRVHAYSVNEPPTSKLCTVIVLMDFYTWNLKEYLHLHFPREISNNYISRVLTWFIFLARGLCFLHIGPSEGHAPLMHRDVKLSNVLISSENSSPVLGDFETTKAVGCSTLSRVGSKPYTAPEIENGRDYDERCDIFSLGCLFVAMCHGSDSMELSSQSLPKEFSVLGLPLLISSMRSKDPRQRPTIKEVVDKLADILNCVGALESEPSSNDDFPKKNSSVIAALLGRVPLQHEVMRVGDFVAPPMRQADLVARHVDTSLHQHRMPQFVRPTFHQRGLMPSTSTKSWYSSKVTVTAVDPVTHKTYTATASTTQQADQIIYQQHQADLQIEHKQQVDDALAKYNDLSALVQQNNSAWSISKDIAISGIYGAALAASVQLVTSGGKLLIRFLRKKDIEPGSAAKLGKDVGLSAAVGFISGAALEGMSIVSQLECSISHLAEFAVANSNFVLPAAMFGASMVWDLVKVMTGDISATKAKKNATSRGASVVLSVLAGFFTAGAVSGPLGVVVSVVVALFAGAAGHAIGSVLAEKFFGPDREKITLKEIADHIRDAKQKEDFINIIRSCGFSDLNTTDLAKINMVRKKFALAYRKRGGMESSSKQDDEMFQVVYPLIQKAVERNKEFDVQKKENDATVD